MFQTFKENNQLKICICNHIPVCPKFDVSYENLNQTKKRIRKENNNVHLRTMHLLANWMALPPTPVKQSITVPLPQREA